MKDFIRLFLKEKKYIIVLDDVRNLSTWEAINFVFPRNGGHGCIIITTRSKKIADAACSNPNHVRVPFAAIIKEILKSTILQKGISNKAMPSLFETHS